MSGNVSSVLSSWGSFYGMTGASVAALIGLMFVVITLVTGRERLRGSHEGTAAFSTPTVVHFGAALLVSAILSAPWRWLLPPSILLTLVGLAGVGYVLRVAFRIKRMPSYDADVEDWVSHTLLPLIAYGVMVGGAVTLSLFAAEALFALGGAVVLMIFIGIHNAWDIVTYIAIDQPESTQGSAEPGESS